MRRFFGRGSTTGSAEVEGGRPVAAVLDLAGGVLKAEKFAEHGSDLVASSSASSPVGPKECEWLVVEPDEFVSSPKAVVDEVSRQAGGEVWPRRLKKNDANFFSEEADRGSAAVAGARPFPSSSSGAVTGREAVEETSERPVESEAEALRLEVQRLTAELEALKAAKGQQDEFANGTEARRGSSREEAEVGAVVGDEDEDGAVVVTATVSSSCARQTKDYYYYKAKCAPPLATTQAAERSGVAAADEDDDPTALPWLVGEDRGLAGPASDEDEAEDDSTAAERVVEAALTVASLAFVVACARKFSPVLAKNAVFVSAAALAALLANLADS